MAGRQITARVSQEMKLRFSTYAAACGLASSELAKLLLHRERQQKQLEAAIKTGQFQPSLCTNSTEGSPPKITVHYSSHQQVHEFDMYIESCSAGLKRGAAAAWILEQELSERWLYRALSANKV